MALIIYEILLVLLLLSLVIGGCLGFFVMIIFILEWINEKRGVEDDR